MSPVLEALREAGRVASAVRDLGARRIVAGARIREVCQEVEDEIHRRGAYPAFPTQSSRNETAAHYCPSPEDETTYEDGDLAKLDVGVHVDGYVVDTALTVNVGDRPENRRAVEAARSALEAAIGHVRAGVEVRRLSAVIETTIRSLGLRPMRNLCGHGVGRWTVHCPPPIPNSPDGSEDRLPSGAVVAIEPFATTGRGLVVERGEAEVFRFDPQASDDPDVDPDVMGAIRAFRGLPFSRRQLARLPRPRVEEALANLRKRRALMAYAPLVEMGGKAVAQAEHTVFVGDEGVEVLTR
ncbi:MAG: type II methionyl aminopeptidase [Vicinamibacteria bacterium]